MAFPLRRLAPTGGSGTFASADAGTVKAAAALQTNSIRLGTLSAYFDVTANTNTLTLTAKWQVSDDNSTWIDLAPLNNAANVVLATGDGSGVDADKVIGAPTEIWGWKYVRAVVVSGVASGSASDTYAIAYRHVMPQVF